ncbi:putative P-loop containing nucleoside triphosphate hydrolase, leucine-rich repeat domain, L [Medicago truncatula]|uniref:Putative P-loop containing nucleoside triphosphate hydrolase, leucine-rich repeat domain, L n=1 Tax=Medicago truncatula TaxID=3880 RepID=A0A396HYM3_MEDTR|nr:putative disease resistance protein RGA3 [Medicago truncatula]XP_024640038.1 putative disease resistance protein RGA3 [Medicago truncatula]XP_024640039.1 putative disease resistance protein RGA3 [Medicago truncatula]XP_024640040.1 putative disease resistance protein RGA3 [Medicago truncatula]XP_024640041.1 putative disease resistance protein RGA3 [Medicago truncatula]XP_024640042.1 putative disease resistance protein RGA3 [Medicago truncatula]XP_024640043.1 putative disease resistance prot
MADALLGVVLQNLKSLVQNELATISGIKSKAQKLSTTLDLVNAVLEDAEQKQVINRSIKVWLQQLKDAVYVLDDILDECSIESARLIASSSFKPKNIIFCREIGKRLKEITRRLDDIAESKNKFHLGENGTFRERSIEVAEWRQTSSIIAEPKVFGREDDKEKIIEFLLTQARDSDFLSVYPIVGLGGVGKTTLVQLVYNDARVSSNFNTKIWVCVSETFSVKRILCSIIESITREKYDGFNLDVIQRKVQELLQGKIYLLILDDVWNKNQQLEFGLSQEKWNILKSVLSCGSKGSSILVSTRDEVVATIMGTCHAHPLYVLSDNECWLLFKQYAFGQNREERAELVEIGKEIVKKCDGLPLAAQALGGLMSSRNEEKEWLEIKESELWALPHENYILPALRLSYFHLTPTLKRCFAFCAMFPKDTEFVREELIHLWMANEFILSRENMEVEDVGSMVWNELCQKSFFQDIKMDNGSGDISFKMHDLVHDLAQSVMGQECMYLENSNMTTLSKSTHHISFHYDDVLSFDEGAFRKVESLRTLFQLNHYTKTKHDYSPTNRSLRVLCTSFIQVPSLGSLIHLRYLELRSLEIKMLPDSIYNLQKLEILKIKDCQKLSCLPKGLACLQNLRHLVIKDCHSLFHMFPYIGKLTCLRTLSVYIVSLEKGNSLAELHDLNLGGKLSIKGLNDVCSLSEAQAANLMGKKDLQELCFSWTSNDGFTKTPTISFEQLFEVLQPHSNLKRLIICHYNRLFLPSWISILSNLVALVLWNCEKCVRLPSFGKLQSLKKLALHNMNDLKYLDDDEESQDGIVARIFPSLEVLILEILPNLEGLLKVERGEMFPCLSRLTISFCPKLGLPCLVSLKNLDVLGCNNELLRSISSFCGLNSLTLAGGKRITSFPDGMFKNLTCLQALDVNDFPKVKELPNEPFSLVMEHLIISSCDELESLPKEIWEGLQSLRTLDICRCKELRCLPEGIRHLTSLELLTIRGCPTLEERCKEGTGEDWYKISHIPILKIL